MVRAWPKAVTFASALVLAVALVLSQSDQVQAQQTAPSQPDAPTLTPATQNSLVATWIAPSNPGLGAITAYILRWRVNGSSDSWQSVTLGNVLTHTITGLNLGTTYEAQVRARNEFSFVSPWSTSGTGTPASAPSTPVAPGVTTPSGVAGRTSLNVTWTAPANGGAAITTYDLRYRINGSSGDWAAANDLAPTSTTLTALNSATTYEVQVRATNPVGDSGWSTSGTGTTAAGPPQTPAAPGVTTPAGAVGRTSLTVTWVAPANGGSPITTYDLRYRISGTSTWLAVNDRTGTAYTLTGLTAGSTYEVGVRATNSIDDSAWSTNGTGTTAAAGVPDTPAAPSVSVPAGAAGRTSLTVTWVAPANGGSPITTYDLRYRVSGTSTWLAVNDRTGTAYTLTGLTASTTYEVGVRATNSAGDSGWSGNSSATTAMPPPNSAPLVSIVTRPRTIAGGAAVSLDATASDEDGDTLSFTWSATPNVGSFVSNASLRTSWTAPAESATAQAVTLKLTVSDQTTTASAQVVITVRAAATLGSIVFTLGQEATSTTYGYKAGGYGTLVSGNFPGELFNDGNARAVDAIYEDASGNWFFVYNGGAANDWQSNTDTLDQIEARVDYANGVNYRAFVLGGFITGRIATSTLRLAPPLPAREWNGRSGQNITITFYRTAAAAAAQNVTRFRPPTAESESFVEWLTRITPGGPVLGQAILVIMVYTGAITTVRSSPGAVLSVAAILVVVPWVPMLWGYGDEFMAIANMANIGVGAFLYKAYFSRTEV